MGNSNESLVPMAQAALTAEAPQAPQGAWGTEGTDAQDVLIPRLLLAQGMSPIVQQGNAVVGSIFNSNTGQTLAKKKEKLVFVPISYFREWHVCEVDDRGNEKLIGRDRITPANENAPKEDVFTKDGKPVPIRRHKAHNFFVLLPKFVEELPFLITFKKSNQMAGKRLVTHLKTSALKGQPAAALTWNLYADDHTYNGRTYPVFNVEPGEATPKSILDIAFKWYNQLSKSQAMVAEAQDEE
ncbi:MAG: hypothetical protein HC841_00045 [Verrucomicrobiae bacterium]|nr:hypothetical protein [Verrucomicrobiae bacterium]